MSTLPHVSGRKVVQALLKIGYEKDRQKGSHIVMRQISYPHRRIVVPDHKEVAKGTLRAIIRHAGLTVEEFAKLL
ncbi:MAG: type II toxin-antitoxin system HicA family toxin [Desulfobacteraceae bacterium]|nr:type II toxin-antitoxin system HicA family toxin [Desulfobacterales bacterium]MDH3575904.1 type II toxin-antitoxin system HicA family toxin [Desulfobacteraceae bacterium]